MGDNIFYEPQTGIYNAVCPKCNAVFVYTNEDMAAEELRKHIDTHYELLPKEQRIMRRYITVTPHTEGRYVARMNGLPTVSTARFIDEIMERLGGAHYQSGGGWLFYGNPSEQLGLAY